MAKVIFGMAVSLDGFVNDANGNVERLYPDFEAMRESESIQEAMRDTGAVVMGRHSYDMANGDFTNYEFQTPIFVVTHHPPEQVAKGENDKLKFHFITDGVESAIEKAKAAAGPKDVYIIGGASIGQQCLNAGLVDELQMLIVPVILGDGLRLYEHLRLTELEKIRVIDSPAGTEIRYRVKR